MQIIQSVVVKQVLTEKSKQQLFDKYHAKKRQFEKECDQLQFELKRLEKSKNYPQGTLKKHFEKEIEMRREKIKLLDFQIEQLHILPIGSELKEKEVQALIEVKAGDLWIDQDLQPEIIVKDGIIEEIRR